MARILIVDDDEVLLDVLAATLKQAGHAVLQATDGRQAVQICRTASVDLVVTDILMPGQEGLETMLALRRDHAALPVIVMSGGATHSQLYLNMAAKLGASRVLAKPFAPAALLKAIDDLLADQPTPGAPA